MSPSARREKQKAYNTAHDITPTTIKKNIADVMESGYGHGKIKPGEYARAAEEAMLYAAMTPAQLAQKITELEKKMYQHAQDLEFEDAARVRDEIARVQAKALGMD